jgi:hypothetical protein
MKTQYPEVPWMDPNFLQNQRKFPWEELQKYADLHVAWSWDGTRIVASGKTNEEVYENVKQAGLDPARVVFSFVEVPE